MGLFVSMLRATCGEPRELRCGVAFKLLGARGASGLWLHSVDKASLRQCAHRTPPERFEGQLTQPPLQENLRTLRLDAQPHGPIVGLVSPLRQSFGITGGIFANLADGMRVT